MRRWVIPPLLSLVAAPALAVFCARDVVPAATLLVPYVEVSMDGALPDRNGTTTILRVTNTAPEATLVQLIVWDVLGEPAVVIHAALSGFDMWTVDFADVLEGRWSRFDTSLSAAAFPNTETADLKRTPFEWGPDGRSSAPPTGPVRAPYTAPWSRGLPAPQATSELDGGGCGVPYGDTTGLMYAPLLVEKLQDPLFKRTHAGCPESPWGRIVVRYVNDWLADLTGNPLFFYATVHVVRTCSSLTPADAGHAGLVAADRNVLLGEVEFVDPSAGTLELGPAVHLEAAHTPAQLAAIGPFEASTGLEDRREPLGTAFAFHYVNDYDRSETSQLVVWKPFWELDAFGPLVDPREDVMDCGAYMYYAWDEDEHVITRGIMCPVSPCCGGDIDPNEMPFVAQRVPLTPASFDLPAVAGWMMLILPPSYAGFTQDPTPGANERYPRYQAAVAVRTVVRAGGNAGASWVEAAVVGNAHCQPGGAR
ncbi:MAG: hypothetical protein KA072_02645 [Thermoanaerobaculaceae bacterium]|nr:hypothetical protein [Thermoanaerobaculaceae bacterium]MDI9620501.1 hypothetical protein [Acidobacteriota bacterium]HPW56253.1 hypothetical protein [Thermoanaerobaculaceae bacterium]